MTTLPEEAVKAAIAAHNKYYDDLVIYPSEEPTPEGAFHAALKGALPFLPVQGAVKKLKWNEYNDEQGIPDRWDAEASSFGVFYSIEIQHDGYRVVFDHEAVGAVGVFDTLEAAKAAAQADYEARILSALEPSADACQCTTIQQDETCPVGYPSLLCEICDGKGVVQPSAARELALEEAARVVKRRINLVPSNTKAFRAYQEACRHILSDLRTLSSPDHADAGKVEGDARADLERFWRPISEADRTITYEDTFNLGDGKSMTIRNSDHFWVRDADGRVYEATWSDHKGGYWWDLEGESRVDPVEYMPHPLSLPSALSEGAE